MGVSFDNIKNVKTKDGKWNATARCLEITLRFDMTTAGSLTQGRLNTILNTIVDTAKESFEDNKVAPDAVEGNFAWYYGPYFKGTLS